MIFFSDRLTADPETNLETDHKNDPDTNIDPESGFTAVAVSLSGQICTVFKIVWYLNQMRQIGHVIMFQAAHLVDIYWVIQCFLLTQHMNTNANKIV